MFRQSLHMEDNDVNSYGALYVINLIVQLQVVNNQIHLFALIFDR